MTSPLFRRLLSVACLAIVLRVAFVSAQDAAPEPEPAPAEAAALTPDGCVAEIRSRLHQQQRIWRGVLHGVRSAEDLRDGNVVHDEDGLAWIKTGADRWVRPDDDSGTTARTNAGIDATREWTGMNEPEPKGERKERLGAYERPGAVTSQLIPLALAGFGDLECRVAMVCEGVRATLVRRQPGDDGRLRIRTPGCEELLMEPVDRCEFGEIGRRDGDAVGLDLDAEQTDPQAQCERLATQLLDREAAFLRIATSYDAAYRSLLQFAGGFDGFLRGLRGDLLGPIEDLFPLANALSRMPCFPGPDCNE